MEAAAIVVPMDRISHDLMIIVGFVMLSFGIVGNLLNINVFSLWSFSRGSTINYRHLYRTSNSPLYLFVSSIANLLLIIYGLSTRILFDGFQYQVKANEVFLLCKFRTFSLHTFDMISIVCLCMATFDRYLVSSREVRLRRLSTTRKGTIFIIFLLISLISFHGIPLFIYFQATSLGQCFVNSEIYTYYYRFVFQIILHGLFPIFFFSLFGILTFKQLKILRGTRQKSNQNIDKQLSRMLLLMSITIVLSSIPYTIESIYYLLFANESEQQTSVILLCHNISSLLFYTNPVCSFYIYFVSTPNFRKQLKKICRCDRTVEPMKNTQVNTITMAWERQQMNNESL